MIRAALLAYAKHSLGSLTITSIYQKDDGLLGTFCEFTSLRELETNVDLLIPEAQFEELIDLLPASIEKVHLHTGDLQCCDGLLSLVENFQKAKSQRLPNLRSLKLSSEFEMGVTQRDKDVVKTMEETCSGCWDRTDGYCELAK